LLCLPLLGCAPQADDSTAARIAMCSRNATVAPIAIAEGDSLLTRTRRLAAGVEA
jgi:hypothetical protein